MSAARLHWTCLCESVVSLMKRTISVHVSLTFGLAYFYFCFYFSSICIIN